MATLTGTQIRNTYESLIKIGDNGEITTSYKGLTDGVGNTTAIAIKDDGIRFTGDVDFSTAGDITGDFTMIGQIDLSGEDQCMIKISNDTTGCGISFEDDDTTNENQVGIGAFVNDLCLRAGGENNAIRIKSTGRVGIATSNPDEQLHIVGGTLKIDDDAGNDFTFPSTDGDADQVMITDGNGNLSWADQSGGGGGGTPALPFESIQFNDSGDFGGSSRLTWQNATSKLNTENLKVNGYLEYNEVADADEYIGDMVNFGNSGTYTIGDIYFLSSSGDWELASSGSVDDAGGLLGIATETSTNRFMVKGEGRHAGWTGGTTGQPAYLAGDGQITPTAPTGKTDVIRQVGWYTDGGLRKLYFDPSNIYFEK